MSKQLGLYIHIPFCKQKCAYCDFCSFESTDLERTKYVDYLLKEMELYHDKYGRLSFDTIFIGGGTPTVLRLNEMTRIVEGLNKYFDCTYVEEFSVESNPGTVTLDLLKGYRELGINRISMGLQATQNDLLKTLGRIHTYETFCSSFELIREAGFENVNIDLMYGLPNQNEEQWVETLKRIVKLEPEHISAYSLKVEEGTPFEKMYERNELTLPSEEQDRRNHHYAIDYLKSKGYKQYEISNFSKEEHECKHNLIYWRCQPYIGLGLAAHGYFDSTRYGNTAEISSYYSSLDQNKIPVEIVENINENDKIFETFMLGLRLNEGVSYAHLKHGFSRDVHRLLKDELRKLIDEDLLEEVDESIRFTRFGMDISNSVLVRILEVLEKESAVC